MSENRNRGIQDFSKYDAMETQELEEILRLDADAPEGEESDTELLLYVMGVLADRKRNSDNPGKTAQESLESFRQNYLHEEEYIEIAPEAEKPKRRPLRWLRGMAAAAAVLVFVVFGSVTANAFGFDIWKTIVEWTKETFHFVGEEQTKVDEPKSGRDLAFSSLEDALYRVEKVSGLVPTWIPDGYVLEDITVDETPMQKVYIGYYKNGEKNLKITVRSYLNSYPEQIEQSEDLTQTYEASGTTYYMFADNDQMRAAWINGSYECYISGELTVEELKTMIDSIEKG